MGYEVHIVRRNDYDDYEEQSNIRLEEWLQYVASDKELKLTNGYSNFPNDTWYESEGFSIWLDKVSDVYDGEIWFDYGFGSIRAKNPDDKTVRKMVQMASSLKAKVYDDNCFLFDETFTTFDEFEKQRTALDNQDSTDREGYKSSKPWWKFW